MSIRQHLTVVVMVVFGVSCLHGYAADEKPVPKSDLVQKLEAIFYDPSFAKIPDRLFPAIDYGVKADGKTVSTKFLQAAIDAAHKAGGGVVTLPQGTTVTGALFVKSNVELRLDKGVVLQAVQDDSHYPRMPTRIAGIEMNWLAAVINVYEAENVRITGEGVIDGNGVYWWKKFHSMASSYVKRKLRWALDYDCERVRPIVVWKSKNVLLKGFRVERAGFWTCTLTYSDRVHVDGLVIRNNIGGHGPSTDGVNTDSSSNVLVENCDVDCNDDTFTLKAGKDADGLRVNRPTENVVYRNSIARRGSALFTIGSETSGGIRNIEVYGLKSTGTMAGFSFKSAKVRGGVIENLYFHDMEIDRARLAFACNLNWFPDYSYPTIPETIPEEEITERWRKLTERVEPPERGIPEFRNLRFENITATDSQIAMRVNAYEEKPIRNVVWENCHFNARDAGHISHAADWTFRNVTLNREPFRIKTTNCENVQVPAPPELSLPADVETQYKMLDGGGIRIEAEWMWHPDWELGTKYPGFEGKGYSSPPKPGETSPLIARIKTAAPMTYTVSVRAMKGGAHQDRAVAVEVAGKRLKTTHQGEGPAAGAYSWEAAGTVMLPAGTHEIKVIPVGKKHPQPDVIMLTPVEVGAQNVQSLEEGFKSPTGDARPWTYWFWINGNITKEGITADLESMARVGINGVLIMEVSYASPGGNVAFMSTQWRELFKHTLVEANRLGIQVNMNNDAGWTGSGGPWNTPENSMQQIVSTRLIIEGGQRFEGVLPQPTAFKGFYRDIGVLAKTIAESSAPTLKLTASSITRNYGPDFAQDGLSNTRWVSKGGVNPTPERPQSLQFEYDQAWSPRGIHILSYVDCGPKDIEIQYSEDGETYRTIKKATMQPEEDLWLEWNNVRAKFFRVLFLSAHPYNGQEAPNVQVAEIELMSQQDFADKRESRKLWDRSKTVDLTSRMDTDGRLTWDVPDGKWEVVRIGHTSNGRKNQPAPVSGLGLECDKLSQEAIERHFEDMMAKLIADAGPLAGKVLSFTHVDSWEVDGQNWTSNFREEFQRLRGYDPLKLLPAEMGGMVDNPEITERFRWDFSMTVNDLLLENYAAHLRRLANKHGLKLSAEAFHSNPCIDQAYAGRSDMPMGEFWTHGGGMEWCKEMASASHIYGKGITGAEAFTSLPAEARYQNHPYLLKTIGDAAFCEGINRMIFHCFTHQPWLDRAPGMTMGPFGLHNDRTQTWWEASKVWNDYLARCQYLLQKGLFVADVFYLDVEVSPRRAPYFPNELKPSLPAGYDYDIGPAEVLASMTVKEGRLVLPDGMSYRMLVLPPTDKMTPETLIRVRDLAQAGATLVAPTRPRQSPSLQDYPAADRNVQQIAQELFGDAEIPVDAGLIQRELGAGRVLLTQNLSAALDAIQIKPDIEFANVAPQTPLRWIHRKINNTDIYFISNQKKHSVLFDGLFRVEGRKPELWHPETGRTYSLPDYREEDGRMRLPLRLGPAESVFIVFRESAEGRPSTGGLNWAEFEPLMDITGPWHVTFHEQKGGPASPVAFENPFTFNQLEDWILRPEPQIKYFSGTADYRNEFILSDEQLSNRQNKIFLNLGQVEVMASVTLNGEEIGTVWKPPYRIDVTGHLKHGRNKLEVRVVNLLVNRLIGDEQLPQDSNWANKELLGQKYQILKDWPKWLLEGKSSPTGRATFSTVRYHQKDSPLLPSGLLGPVRLELAE